MKRMFLAIIGLAFTLILFQDVASAQTKEQTAAELASQQADKLADLLELEGWQVFYVDSILTANYLSLQAGFADLSAKKVSNRDIYQDLQYSKLDEIYYALEKVFDESQWAKYLKRGAAKDKKSREKYFAKKNK